MNLTRESLGFILAIDGCARNCAHCPAYSLGIKPVMATMIDLRERLRRVRRQMPSTDFANFRTIHCWRISDPADYRYSEDGVTYDIVSVAEAWKIHLGQPLYVVTNGTIGSRARRETLEDLANHPELVSQVKLTITPFDQKFHLARYVENMAFDVATLWPLGLLPGCRFEANSAQRKFRINVKATAEQHGEVLEVLRQILTEAGLSKNEVRSLLTENDERLKIKPVYDLRISQQQPFPEGAISIGDIKTRLKVQPVRDQLQLGFRPDGRGFAVDLAGFREIELGSTFDSWF